MNELLKYLGIIIIIIASIVLVLSHFLGWNNINAVQFGKVAICSCGTGSPFFTTDTAAALDLAYNVFAEMANTVHEVTTG